jgi:hypothetical protein
MPARTDGSTLAATSDGRQVDAEELDALIGLAVPGRPIRSLVAEDRSAEGVRDQTGPGTLRRSVLGPQPTGYRGQQRARAVTGRSLEPQFARPTAF